jgi:hypothetical protein
MLQRIRSARVNLKTGLLILALALLMWAMVVWAGIRDFVPEELTQPPEAPVRTL